MRKWWGGEEAMRRISKSGDIRPIHKPGEIRDGTDNPFLRTVVVALKSRFVSAVTLGLGVLTLASPYSFADAPKTRWENHVSRHCTFTLLKPSGWIVKESYQDNPRMWAFSVTEPNGSCQVTSAHGTSPTGLS